MRSASLPRSSRRAAQRFSRAAFSSVETLETRLMLSTYNLSSYSSVVTDIQTQGAYATDSAYVNGGPNNSTGPFQYDAFAVVEYDPSNSTIFPGTTVTTPTNVTLKLVNNPDAYNSTTGATGNIAVGSFDVYLLPTYTTPVGATNIDYLTGSSLPLGLEGQGGLSSVTASNFYLGTFNAPAVSGPFTVNLTLPTGSSSAATSLTTDLSTGAKFELAITPHTTTSSAQFAGDETYVNGSGNATNPSNGVVADNSLQEDPNLALTVNAVAENFTTPYGTTASPISVDQNNTAEVAEINVQRNGYSGDTATVNWITSNGTGSAGTNFGTSGNSTQDSGTLSFGVNQTEAVITVPIIDTGSSADATFTVTLSSPSASVATATLGSPSASVVKIVGTTDEADSIGGTTDDDNGNASYLLNASASDVQIVAPTTGTYAPVVGSVNNGAGGNNGDDQPINNDFTTQSYVVMAFNASAAQSAISVTGLSALTLELDNVNSNFTEYSDTTPYSTPNPEQYGNFNVYLLTSSATSVPTQFMAFEGADSNGGGINGQAGALLLGTASFSDQSTNSSQTNEFGEPEGVQDVYTLELTTTAASDLKTDLNATGNAYQALRLAITPGSSAFAALFANNNSGTGGNYGIQPYLWFDGTSVAAPPSPESFAINYSNISVDANESVVEVDVTRSPSGYTGDTATVGYTLSTGGSGVLTFSAEQVVSTLAIPLTPNPNLSSESNFTVSLDSVSVSGNEGASYTSTPTTITIEPDVTPSQTVLTSLSFAGETGAIGSSTFGGYAYINGSVYNGTGSFAFQGFQVFDFTASSFVNPGQSISSLSDFSLGLANYENQTSAPGSNYGGPPGDFTLYIAGADQAQEINADADYNASYLDGVGGFTSSNGVGPYSPTTIGAISTFYAVPLGVVSFNTKLGLDYFTPTKEALDTTWVLPAADPAGNTTVTPLQLMEDDINNGDDVRIMAAPGNSAFHAYFYGSNSGASGAGGPDAPQLLVNDTISTTQPLEAVNFSSSAYNVDTSTSSVTVTVDRSLLDSVPADGMGDTLTVGYSTFDGNAYAGTNYTSQNGILTFLPNQTTATITVTLDPNTISGGDKAFTIALSSPSTSNTASYAIPELGSTSTATVYITDNSNNAQTLTQYTSDVGDIGTNGPVTFGTSALNPTPPVNYSIFTKGHLTALDFNESSVDGYNNPSNFNSSTGPITPTGSNNSVGPTYNATEGPVVYTPSADTSDSPAVYNATIQNINQITLNFVNFFASNPGMLMNVYLVSDLQNINPGIGGTSKNPHFYDTTFDNLEPTQVLSFSGVPTGGSFALSYNSQTTGTITYATGSGGLTATTIQSELDALSSIIALGGVSVSGTTGGTSFTITFNRANIDYGQISATSVALTGGTSPSASVTNVYQTAAVGDGVGLGSEVLTFSTAPTAGTFTLSYNSQTTGSISASGLTALVIQNALDSLSSVAALGGVTVTGTSSATTYTITFNDAYLGDAYGQISGSSNLTSNSGNTAVTLSVSNPFQWGTGYLLGTITNPSSVYWNGYVDVPMTTFSASAETALINDLNNGNEFRILLSPATPNTGLNGDLIYNYTNANQSYAADTGLPLNYYIQPELSFDVSYASNGGFAALPAYITPSANADYIYDSGTNTLTLTNGSLTFTKSSLSAGASAINVDVVGPTASIYFSAASGYTSQNLSLGSLTLSGGAFAQITPNTGALTVTSLSIGTGCSLDVTNNHMYIDYGSNTDPKSSILSYLVTGSNGGTWSGQGIFSSTAATTTGYGVGYSDGADGIDSSLTSGEIEVAYAQYGDITLSGLVNAQDFSDLTAHFGKTTSNGWEVGDFYYTGQVNGADFSLLTANFGKTGSGEDVSTPPAPSDDAGTVSTPSVVTESTPTTAAVVAAPTITTATSSDSTTSAPLVVDDKPKKKSKPAVAAVIFSADGSTPGALQDVDGDKKFFSGQ